jgi:hypothetical protein
MLAYGSPADTLDEYLKIGKCTALECLDKFAQGVIEVFGRESLRPPHVRSLSTYYRLMSHVVSQEC